MSRALVPGAAALLLLAAAAAAGEPRTPDEFLARGRPTFVVGTLGDDACDRRVRAQAELIRGMLFPDARVLDDTEVDLRGGPSAWPENPVLYGGPHVNALVRAIGDRLPFSLSPGRLAIGDLVLEGREYRIVAVVPGSAGPAADLSWPPFLLYAGAGDPGVEEINGISHGGEGFLVADRFGRLAGGFWESPGGGAPRPAFTFRARRIAWRATEFPLPAGDGLGPAAVVFHRAEMLPAAEGEAGRDAAFGRAVSRARDALGATGGFRIDVFLYPDRRSKQSLTGNGGDGHADPASRTLHVLEGAGPGFEALVTHEAAHLIADAEWGPPGTPLLAEGLAVWASGGYGGLALADWRERRGDGPPDLATLLTRFRRLPEPVAYPAAGLFFGALVGKVGLAKVRDHLYGAAPEDFAAACHAAGLEPGEAEALLR